MLKDTLNKDLDIVLELGYQSSSLSLFLLKGSSKIILIWMEWVEKAKMVICY